MTKIDQMSQIYEIERKVLAARRKAEMAQKQATRAAFLLNLGGMIEVMRINNMLHMALNPNLFRQNHSQEQE